MKKLNSILRLCLSSLSCNSQWSFFNHRTDSFWRSQALGLGILLSRFLTFVSLLLCPLFALHAQKESAAWFDIQRGRKWERNWHRMAKNDSFALHYMTRIMFCCVIFPSHPSLKNGLWIMEKRRPKLKTVGRKLNLYQKICFQYKVTFISEKEHTLNFLFKK